MIISRVSDSKSNNYVLSVGRFVEEKGFDLLINAFSRINAGGIKLVLAGDSDHETSYSVRLKELAKSNNVVLTGYVRGDELQQLFNNCRLYVLSSYNEGLPLALLEAMSYKLPVLSSNIPASVQIQLPEDSYFISGNEESLSEKLMHHLKTDFSRVEYDMTPYDWNNIASQTKAVYKEVSKSSRDIQIETPKSGVSTR